MLCISFAHLSKLGQFHNFAVILILSALFGNGQNYMVGNNPYHQKVSLDSEGRYKLEWLVNWDQKEIAFTVTAHTTGYVGFGLSQNGKMTGADIIIGGVDSRGHSYFGDYYAVENQTPLRDPSQDWHLLAAHENGSHTMISFSRVFDTCDPQDYAITEDKISIIWAIGGTDKINYHFNSRGVYHVYFLDLDYTPEIITDYTTGVQRVLNEHGNQEKSINVWTLNREMIMPTQETLYWCTMHQGPRLQQKNQLIGFNVRLHTEASRRHVHHLILLRCRAPPGRSARQMFAPFLQSAGQECVTFWESSGDMPTEYCEEFAHVWAAGGRAHFNPPHVAFQFESEAYYLLQVHLDNPTFIVNERVSMSIDTFYTEKIRKNEASFFALRQQSPGLSPSFLLPPGLANHQIRGICGEQCTQNMIPPEGITVYGALTHAHNTARKMRVRHFRNNKELPYIVADENYMSRFQQVRNFRHERRVLPGDQLVAECVYDTTASNRTVVGGLATSQEMCTMDLMHYQRITHILVCGSEVESVAARRYFLAGVENITWTNNLIEFTVDPPHRLAGLAISEVSDHHVNWSHERRQALVRLHTYHPQVNQCRRILSVTGGSSEEQQRYQVTYPYGAKPHQPEAVCSRNRNKHF